MPASKKDSEVTVQGRMTVEDLISQAVAANVPVDSLERILAMRRELKAEQAKEDFDRAMARFQQECPTIVKTKEVRTSGNAVAYRYAPLESIVDQVKEALGRNGFSYATRTQTLEGKVISTVIAKHTGGHSEESSMEVPLGNRTNVMSASQVVAAATTFAKRYAFCNAFGILTGDEDDDAQSTKEPETAAQDPASSDGGKEYATTTIEVLEKKMVDSASGGSKRAELTVAGSNGPKKVTAFKNTYFSVHAGGTYRVVLELGEYRGKPQAVLYEVLEELGIAGTTETREGDIDLESTQALMDNQ